MEALGVFRFIDYRRRNHGGLLRPVAVDVRGQSVPKGENIARVGGGVRVDVVLVRHIQNWYIQIAWRRFGRGQQQRREWRIRRPEPTAGPVGVVVEDYQVDAVEPVLRQLSQRGASLTRTPSGGQDDVSLGAVLRYGIRDPLGSQQERDDLRRAVPRLRVVRAVIRRA